jgi:hypothetical protein
MPFVPQQFSSKCLPNRGALTKRSDEHPLGHRISKHRQVIVTNASVHLDGPSHTRVSKLNGAYAVFTWAKLILQIRVWLPSKI